VLRLPRLCRAWAYMTIGLTRSLSHLLIASNGHSTLSSPLYGVQQASRIPPLITFVCEELTLALQDATDYQSLRKIWSLRSQTLVEKITTASRSSLTKLIGYTIFLLFDRLWLRVCRKRDKENTRKAFPPCCSPVFGMVSHW
jgi:hypothetical protein